MPFSPGDLGNAPVRMHCLSTTHKHGELRPEVHLYDRRRMLHSLVFSNIHLPSESVVVQVEILTPMSILSHSTHTTPSER